VAANQGVLLMMAHALTGDDAYLHAATDALDYLLGRNATGYSFVTGHGSRPPLNPHHRPSRADGVGAPVPGLLVGGPNPGREDGCTTYPSTLPARSYTDTWCSYASNEIAINWNAPLVFLAVAVEAAYGGGVVRTEDAPETGALRLRVLPNPTAGDVAVRFTLDAPGAATLRLVDALGREVARVEPGLLAAGEQHVALATAHLPVGRYTVQVATAASAATGSVVVVR
jgi:endoglucanase